MELNNSCENVLGKKRYYIIYVVVHISFYFTDMRRYVDVKLFIADNLIDILYACHQL